MSDLAKSFNNDDTPTATESSLKSFSSHIDASSYLGPHSSSGSMKYSTTCFILSASIAQKINQLNYFEKRKKTIHHAILAFINIQLNPYFGRFMLGKINSYLVFFLSAHLTQ